MFKVIKHKGFDIFIMSFIIANVITMAIDQDDTTL